MLEVAQPRGTQGQARITPAPASPRLAEPPFYRPARHVRPPRRSRWRRAALPLCAAAMAGAFLFALMTDGGRITRTAVPLAPGLDDIARFAGFGLDQVSVAGYRFTPEGDILEALDLKSHASLVGYDTAAALKRIEALPWVASAEMKRIWPGEIEVRVKERKPFALWSHKGRHVLIDATGRELSAVAADHAPELPRVSGEAAAADAPQLFEAIARHEVLARELAFVERVAGRRWTLHLKNNSKILLPADREIAALEELSTGAELGKALAKSNGILDLRITGRVSWRSADAAADTAGPRTPGPGNRK